MRLLWIFALTAACDSPAPMNATSPDLAPVRSGCAAKAFGDCVECCNDHLWFDELIVYSCQDNACGVQCADSYCANGGGAPSGSVCDTCLHYGWQPMGIIAGPFGGCETNASCKPVLDCVSSCVL